MGALRITMEGLLDKLGINWKLFIAQLVNFGILLFVLYKFLYKPILAMLEKRARIIEKSIDEARKTELGISEAQKRRENLINEAKIGAKKIIDEAKLIADKQKEDILNKAREENERIIKSGAAIVKREKETAKLQLEKEMGKVLITGLEKTIGRIITEEEQKKIMEESIDSLKLR